jgi:hypothetical protein
MQAPMRKDSSPRRPRRFLTVALAILVLAAVTGTATASDGGGKSTKALFWGAQIGSQLTGRQAPWDMGAMTAFERNTKKPLSLLAFYSTFADCKKSPCEYYGFPTVPFEQIRERGAIPFFSWSSSSTGQDPTHQPEFQLRKIINGRYDSFIRGFAENSKKWGHPYFMRFDWEMNGFWFPWNESVNGNRPGEYIKAWRHVHDIFEQVGATNATWVWCPNIALVNRLKNVRQYYPGAKYVDWTCLDGFNWGDTRNSAGWMTFKETFSSTYSEIMKFAASKPMVIGETASEERGGSKAGWIKETLNVIPRDFPKIRGLVWFDEKDQSQDWPIESSKSATMAFANAIANKIWRPNLYAHLANRKIAPPTLAPPPTEAPKPVPEGYPPNP